MHMEKKIRYNVTIKISLCIPSPVIYGRLEGGRRGVEPLGSAANVEETWLPGNSLVTKEAEGQWGKTCQRGYLQTVVTDRSPRISYLNLLTCSHWKGQRFSVNEFDLSNAK